MKSKKFFYPLVILLLNSCSAHSDSGDKSAPAAINDPTSFNSDIWKRDNKYDREKMVHNLVDSKRLIGLTKAEVKELLGKPDQDDATGLLYESPPSNGDFETLNIELVNDKVTSCAVHFNP